MIVHGGGKKSDGTLMANNADWRNSQQTHTNSPLKKCQTIEMNAKDRKFSNLDSNVEFGDQAALAHKGIYDHNIIRSTFGTDATWSAQAGSAKLNNSFSRVDTFKKRQE